MFCCLQHHPYWLVNDGLGITGGGLFGFLLFFSTGNQFQNDVWKNCSGCRSCRSRSDLMYRIPAGPRSRGRSEQPVGLQPLDAPAAAGVEGTPVRLSQGCGGGEGANTTQHKERTHTGAQTQTHTAFFIFSLRRERH